MTTTTTHEATTVAPNNQPSVIVWHDPRKLVAHPANVRKELGDLDGLARSIALVGVLEPLIVTETAPGEYLIVAGWRRASAAIQAGADLVPIWPNGTEAAVDQLRDMMIENLHRKELSSSEEAHGYQQLAAFDLTPSEIAKQTGRALKVVKAGLAVAASETATTVADRHALTLEQAAVVAEFEDSRDAVRDLVATAVQRPAGFKHLASQMRTEREDRAVAAKAVATLTAQGLTVIEAPGWSYDGPTTELARLVDANGEPIDNEAHLACPGHVVAIAPDDPTQCLAYCIDPAANGHRDRFASTGAKGATSGAMTEDQKAERRTVVANNKAWRAAEPVRREHIASVLARRSVPRGAMRFLVADIMAHPDRLVASDELLSELTGRKPPKGYGHEVGSKIAADTPDTRLGLALLAQVAAAIEESTGTHTWRQGDSRAAAWFGFLTTTGYDLAEVEQLVVTQAAPKKGKARAA